MSLNGHAGKRNGHTSPILPMSAALHGGEGRGQGFKRSALTPPRAVNSFIMGRVGF
jgi:hypothetical protein